MLSIPCPNCGPRAQLEFAYMGAADRTRPQTDDIASWRRYLYFHPNSAGWTAEHWLHVAGCGGLIRIERERSTNESRAVDGCREAAR